MANYIDLMKSYEDKAIGLAAWLTSHGAQLAQMKTQFEAASRDIQDLIKQISAMRLEIDGMKKQ